MSDSPVGQALVLCAQIDHDPATGRIDLLDIYGSFKLASFPSRKRLSFFVAITGAVGTSKICCWLNFPDDRSAELIETIQKKLSAVDEVAQFAVHAELEFLMPGRYSFAIEADDVPILEKHFWVIGP